MTDQILSEPRPTHLPDWTPKRVLKLRRRLRLEQKDLAALLKVHYMTVSKWERGLRRPDIASMRLLDEVAAG